MIATRRRTPTTALVTALLAVCVLLAACSPSRSRSQAHPTTTNTTTTSTPPAAATFEKVACNDLLHEVGQIPERTATCGYLLVPEDRAKPKGRMVRIAIARLHSKATHPKSDPVVFLHGGPGIATLGDGIGTRLSSPVLDERDLILFDQRGSGRSVPDLQCPERERAFVDALADPKPYAEELATFDAATGACYHRLTATGVDLDQYDTEANAADLADLRVALGIKQWNLWGISYGTRLALTEMRDHPEGIRSVVLDSVYPPNAGAVDDVIDSSNRALTALANGCGTDPACHAAFPDVAGDVAKVIDHLDQHPYSFRYQPPDGSQPRQLHLTGAAAAGGIFNAMYSTDLISQLPSLIHRMANGNYAVVPAIAQTSIPFVNDMSEGAYLSIECADNGARSDAAKVASLRSDPGRAAIALLAGWNVFCKDWPVTPLPRSFGDVVHSAIPSLVIAGEYDPTTPAAHSRAVAQALSHSVFVEVPRGGHSPDSECARDVFARFLDDLDRVDARCATTAAPLPFATG